MLRLWAVVLALVLFQAAGSEGGEPLISAVMIGDVRIAVEVADTPEGREKGLSGRDVLPPDQGMLFVYPSSHRPRFWMKNTRFPLSIAFIDEAGTILDIEDMEPLDDRNHHTSRGLVRYALEVSRGWFAAHRIKPGDRVKFVSVHTRIEGVAIGAHKLRVEVVDTPETISRGLMFRDHLPDDQGMLFVFPRLQPLSFWMKNTRIPLSIAFLDADRRILNLDDMAPFDEKARHRSKGPALYALEVRQGWFARRAIAPGTRVIFLSRSREEVRLPRETAVAAR